MQEGVEVNTIRKRILCLHRRYETRNEFNQLREWSIAVSEMPSVGIRVSIYRGIGLGNLNFKIQSTGNVQKYHSAIRSEAPLQNRSVGQWS